MIRQSHSELVAAFENTNSTVESFNKLFTNCKLDSKYEDSDIVEILDIVRIPQTIIRMVKINDKCVEHSFEPYKKTASTKKEKKVTRWDGKRKSYYVLKGRSKKRTPTVYKLALYDKNGTELKKFYTYKEVKDFTGIPESTLYQHLLYKRKSFSNVKTIKNIKNGDYIRKLV